MALPAAPTDIPAEALSVFKKFAADTRGYQRVAYYVGWVVVGGIAVSAVVSASRASVYRVLYRSGGRWEYCRQYRRQCREHRAQPCLPLRKEFSL